MIEYKHIYSWDSISYSTTGDDILFTAKKEFKSLGRIRSKKVREQEFQSILVNLINNKLDKIEEEHKKQLKEHSANAKQLEDKIKRLENQIPKFTVSVFRWITMAEITLQYKGSSWGKVLSNLIFPVSLKQINRAKTTLLARANKELANRLIAEQLSKEASTNDE